MKEKTMRENRSDEYTPNPILDVGEEDLLAVDPPEEPTETIEQPAQELTGGEIVETGANPVMIYEPPSAVRVARAVQFVDGVVTNVILVGVDSDDAPVGFEVPYGTELVVVEDESPVAIGWHRIDDEFVNPDE